MWHLKLYEEATNSDLETMPMYDELMARKDCKREAYQLAVFNQILVNRLIGRSVSQNCLIFEGEMSFFFFFFCKVLKVFPCLQKERIDYNIVNYNDGDNNKCNNYNDDGSGLVVIVIVVVAVAVAVVVY